MKFIDLPISVQKDFIRQYSDSLNIPAQVIEKDWWVSTVLRALFALPYAESISFKGGTSLSKCWGLIERFSEDIDIAIDREYLGYGGELSKTQISDRLRRAACSFVREKLKTDLHQKMVEQGVDAEKFDIEVIISPVSTTDPETIYVRYNTLFHDLPYIASSVKVEVSGRSMNEPVETQPLRSMLEEQYPNAPFAEASFAVRVVKLERTFLEKICLLHEEYSKVDADIRIERMSRHLYDVYKLDKAGITDIALSDPNLFKSIIEHRRKFIGLKGFDYNTLYPETLCIVPPEPIIEKWKEDYKKMIEYMSYGQQPSFEEVMENIRMLNQRLKHDLSIKASMKDD